MADEVTRRALARRLLGGAPLVLVGIVPAALLCAIVAVYTLNHFFAHAPYLLDAGWYSDIVYRAGLAPRNSPIACNYADWYFGVHFSPMISAFSALSYLQPLPRIEWYAVHQAAMFLPFGVAVYLMSRRIDPDGALRRLPVTALAALAFTFNGQIIKMIPYPHYEVAIGGGVCLLLVALATGRVRLAWVFLALTLAVREDAGVHAACALAALVVLHWRGAELAISRRTLFIMIGVALASTVLGIFFQKVVFRGAAVMSAVYLGDPLYSHLSGAVIVDRLKQFADVCQVMYFPFLATCVIAAVRRDPYYLLGWAFNLPWFVLNFLASQPQKATFEAYAGFPFVASIFWVYVYGAKLAPAARRMRPIVLEAVFAAVCLTATIGMHRAWPDMVNFARREFVKLQPMDRAAVHGFVDALGAKRAEYGKLYADYAVASLALESLRPDDGWRPGLDKIDALAFHTESVSRDHLLPDLYLNELDNCTRIRRTGIVVCTRDRLPPDRFAGLATDVIPASFTFANSLRRPGIRVEERGVTIRNGAGFDAYLGILPKGRYELTWTLAYDGPGPPDGSDVVVVTVSAGDAERVTATAKHGAPTLTAQFDANGGELFWFRSGTASPSTIVITRALIRRLP